MIESSDLTEQPSKSASTPVNEGLPSLELGEKPVSMFEFWPAWIFYLPVVVFWIVLGFRYRHLGLPMCVNPKIHLGGMVGESKIDILEMAGPYAQQYILPFLVREVPEIDLLQDRDEALGAHVDNDLALVKDQNIGLPLVVKPELGCRGAGVRVIEKREDLIAYLRTFPRDRRYILQQLAPYAAEAGVFYERMPDEATGRVTSLTLKYRPTVIGDGKRTLKQLIVSDKRASILRELYFSKNASCLYDVPKAGEEVALAFAGSHCRGSIFRDGNMYISAAFSECIDKIMRDFPEFHYGRLDIKFRSIERLQRGEDFVIIEVNGVSSEKVHIWDSRTSLSSAWSTLFKQYYTLFKMGKKMRAQGFKPPSAKLLVKTWWQELCRHETYPDAQ